MTHADVIKQKPLRLLFPAPVLVDLVHRLTETMSGPGDLPGECVPQQKSFHLCHVIWSMHCVLDNSGL